MVQGCSGFIRFSVYKVQIGLILFADGPVMSNMMDFFFRPLPFHLLYLIIIMLDFSKTNKQKVPKRLTANLLLL